jgi:hypothetical protein
MDIGIRLEVRVCKRMGGILGVQAGFVNGVSPDIDRFL